MCERFKVLRYQFLQSASEPTKIELYGINATAVPPEEFEALKMEWRNYTVTSLERREPKGRKLFTDQYMWDVPVVDKFAMESRKWKCEFVVFGTDSNQVCTLLFFVMPFGQ